ncbi:hypothetical protein KEM55_002712 [Ascosphaera atra]|nr:hypothetical protein KEM55_002712 [Ascosphaera atra]
MAEGDNDSALLAIIIVCSIAVALGLSAWLFMVWLWRRKRLITGQKKHPGKGKVESEWGSAEFDADARERRRVSPDIMAGDVESGKGTSVGVEAGTPPQEMPETPPMVRTKGPLMSSRYAHAKSSSAYASAPSLYPPSQNQSNLRQESPWEDCSVDLEAFKWTPQVGGTAKAQDLGSAASAANLNSKEIEVPPAAPSSRYPPVSFCQAQTGKQIGDQSSVERPHADSHSSCEPTHDPSLYGSQSSTAYDPARLSHQNSHAKSMSSSNSTYPVKQQVHVQQEEAAEKHLAPHPPLERQSRKRSFQISLQRIRRALTPSFETQHH